MAKLITKTKDHIERTNEWSSRIGNMKYFRPSGDIFNENRLQNKKADLKKEYDRFIEYTAEWMYGILTNDHALEEHIHPSEFGNFEFHENEFDKKWWNLAIKVGSGGKIKSGLPHGTHTSEADKNIIYDKFMPAYRALRDNFKMRPWYHWFTDHERYTAERDAMKAIRGVIMSLTGDSREAFDEYYADYHERVNLNDYLVIQREELENDAAQKEQISINDKDLSANANKKITALDVTREIVMQNGFNAQMCESINDMIARTTDNSGTIARFVMSESIRTSEVLEPLVKLLSEKALLINERYDNLLDKGANISEISGALKDGTLDIFKIAFRGLTPINLPLEQHISVAQLITNEFMLNISPAGANMDKYGKYTNMYAVRLPEFIKETVMAVANERGNEEMAQNAEAVAEMFKQATVDAGMDEMLPLEDVVSFDDLHDEGIENSNKEFIQHDDSEVKDSSVHI